MTDQSWDAAAETARATSLSPDFEKALLDYFTSDPSDYDDHRLHYGSDLNPDACQRKTWYRLHGAAKDPARLGDEIRFHGGRVWETATLDALERSGMTIERQVEVRPLRPSAWAWIGHADAVLVERRHLVEVKAPRARYFAMAKGDPKKLVRSSYLWQASAYLHELRRVGKVDTASILFLDREGSNAPAEVQLTDDLVVPLESIMQEEVARTTLLDMKEPPERAPGELKTEVLKGGRKTKKNPNPQRVVRATMHRYSLCSYCPYQGVCQPGPEEESVELAADDPRRLSAVLEAEREWLDEALAKDRAKAEENAAVVGDVAAKLAASIESVTPPDPETVANVEAAATMPRSMGGGGPPFEHMLEKNREDGLAVCLVCNGAEGALPRECPGTRMTQEQEGSVYAGHLDFVAGKWVDPRQKTPTAAGPASPQSPVPQQAPPPPPSPQPPVPDVRFSPVAGPAVSTDCTCPGTGDALDIGCPRHGLGHVRDYVDASAPWQKRHGEELAKAAANEVYKRAEAGEPGVPTGVEPKDQCWDDLLGLGGAQDAW